MCECMCVSVCVGAHMTRHVPNVMVSICLCVRDHAPSRIRVRYLPNVRACFRYSLLLGLL